MHKVLNIFKKSYVLIIISLFYIPLLFATIFSFNSQPKKGDIHFSWNHFSTDGWKALVEEPQSTHFFNSFIIGIASSIIVGLISLLTVYSLWRQKTKTLSLVVNGTSSVPLINPDIITAISLMITMSSIFGMLTFSQSGMMRVIICHVVMALPYGILIMLPKSEKFPKSLMEAAQDLGHPPFSTWFRTYFRHMLTMLIVCMFVTFALSFDDFIYATVTSKTKTIGTTLYSNSFKSWMLAVGSIMLFITLFISFIYSIFTLKRENKKNNIKQRKMKKGNYNE